MIEKQLGPTVLNSLHYLVFRTSTKHHYQNYNGDDQGAARVAPWRFSNMYHFLIWSILEKCCGPYLEALPDQSLEKDNCEPQPCLQQKFPAQVRPPWLVFSMAHRNANVKE